MKYLLIAVLIVVVVLVLYQPLRWCWRRITPEGAKKFAYCSAGLFILVSVYSLQIQRQNTKSNRQVLFAIKDQTSPEAQKRQAQAINAVLVQVDCNTREAIQDGIRQLVTLGIEDAGAVRIVTAECTKNGNSTTTTTGG